MESSPLIATSIAPNHRIELQKQAIKSWLNIGMEVINNNPRDIFMKFSSWKMLASSVARGATIINIKGMVIKDKEAVIEVKETDKAIFPSANLVI